MGKEQMTTPKDAEAMAREYTAYLDVKLKDEVLRPLWPGYKHEKELIQGHFLAGFKAGADEFKERAILRLDRKARILNYDVAAQITQEAANEIRSLPVSEVKDE